MFAGRVVEVGPADQVLVRPRHPYSRALVDAVLTPDADAGLPDQGPLAPPATHGCAYALRCPQAADDCRGAVPPLVDGVACFHPLAAPQPASEPKETVA